MLLCKVEDIYCFFITTLITFIPNIARAKTVEDMPNTFKITFVFKSDSSFNIGSVPKNVLKITLNVSNNTWRI